MDEKKLRRCCFTGHRPEKLKTTEEETKNLLRPAIKQAIADGYTVFLTGMAPGVDIWAAELVLEERKKNDDIKLLCIKPYPDFYKKHTESERPKYYYTLSNADYTKDVSPEYSKGCYQVRNCYMVDHSARVIAAYNGTSGGTRNTINYANKVNVEVVNVIASIIKDKKGVVSN